MVTFISVFETKLMGYTDTSWPSTVTVQPGCSAVSHPGTPGLNSVGKVISSTPEVISVDGFM